MIISHRFETIFIHCRKVAGSSIKVALAPYLGDDDIVIGSWNEILRSGISLNRAARRSFYRPSSLAAYIVARAMSRSHTDAVNIGIKQFYNTQISLNPVHPPAIIASEYLGDVWFKYRKFAFVRNPFDRLASDFFWRRRYTGKISFYEYLSLLKTRDDKLGILHPGCVSNWEMISIGDRLAVDFIGRYENLDEDFAKICTILGLRLRGLHTAEKVNRSRNSYEELYGRREIDLVKHLCREELQHFNYEFPW